MSFEVYPDDFSTRYEIKHAISVVMSIYYNNIGTLTIVAAADDYNIVAIKTGHMLYDTDRCESYIIVNTIIDTDKSSITANGYTANWLLNKRCIADKHTVKNLETDIYDIVNANLRGLPRISTAPPEGLTEKTNAVLHGGQILEEIMPFLEEAELGNKMVWDPDNLAYTFKVYKGKDMTTGIHAVIFSDEQGTAKDLVINDDDSTLKNFAYVTGTLKDDTEFVETVDATKGAGQHEIWLETNVRQEDGESIEACKARVRAYATMELGKYIHRKSFAVSIDPTELGTAYNLGDIVSCVSLRYSVAFNARIKGVNYTLDNQNTKTEVILGDPVLTVLGAMKLNG